MITIQSFTFNGFQENTYIVYNEHNEAIIFDPGMYAPNEFKQFDAFIASKNLKPILLLNTHTHLDHVFGNGYVVEKYNVQLAFHEKDKPVYDSVNQVGLMYGVPFDKAPEPSFFIKEGEKITLGEDEFEIRLTPGHSPGSVCFYHEKQQIVISGDVLFQQSIGRSDLPGGHYETLIQSIQTQLLTLPDETAVYSGHGPVTYIGLERMNNPYLN